MAFTTKRTVDNFDKSTDKKRKRAAEQAELNNLNKYDRISSLITFSNNVPINTFIRSSISTLGLSYLAQMINPFDFRDNPIQSIHLFGRASKLYTSGYRFIFYCSTATGGAGYGFVSVTPYAMVQNTNSAITCSASTTILNYIPTATQAAVTTNYVTTYTVDSPFASSAFATNAREYRIVSCAIRCRNISPRDYLGGSIVGLHTPNNGTAEAQTFLTACDFEHTKPAPFDQEWHTVFWKPTHPDNHVFWPSYTTSFNTPTGWTTNQLAMLIQAPDSTYATKVECEVVSVFEVTGYSERGCEPRARDANEAVQCLALLQNTCSYHGNPSDMEYSIPYDAL
jgi:hypothetical protein